MRLIKVKYTESHSEGLVGECRDLDPDTGNVYENGCSANTGFERTAPGVWSNGISELTEIGAPTTATVSPWETQEGGGHYKGLAIQPMEYSMANGLDACQHTVIKYVTRFRDKGGIEDLKKARHTIDMLIQFEEQGHGQ